jgi:flavin-dependent dehydrogenase
MNPNAPIAIVGGGPAGALASAVLSAGGRQVLLFDEKLAWEKPCGGGLTFKALRQFPFLSEAGAKSNAVSDCELISPSGQRVQFPIQHPVAIFPRLVLNGLLLERARNAGVTLHRERVTRIEGSPGDWRLATPRSEFSASHLILAAGARDPFRAQFLAPFAPVDLMMAVGYYIPGRSSLMQVQFLKEASGYIWVFPRPDHVSAGIAARMGELSSQQLRQLLEDWLRNNGLSLDNARFYAHILPALSTASLNTLRVLGDGWSAIGDSAGLVDPITGEGLYYALRSAELCANALLADNPAQYQAGLEDEILPELRLAARVSQRFYHGRHFGESVPELMIKLTAQSESFRELMSDLFAGIQGYQDLKTRLYRLLPTVMAQGLSSALLRPWSAGGLKTYPSAD